MCGCVCVCVCMCVENVVFTTLRRNVRVGRQKKKKKKRQKVIHICQKQFRFQMNYIFTKGNIPTQIHVLLLFIIYSRQKTTRRSAVRNWESQGESSHQMNWHVHGTNRACTSTWNNQQFVHKRANYGKGRASKSSQTLSEKNTRTVHSK